MNRKLALVVACLAGLSLAACKGDKGDSGAAGTDGTDGTNGTNGTGATSTAWKFGIISDTQWPSNGDDGKNPNSVAVGIIQQVNAQFVAQGVKFVVAVGDLTDAGCSTSLEGTGATACAGMETRALFTQELYDNGIGFFPLRGNHEAQADGALEFTRVFPQTQDGVQNASPDDVFDVSLGTDVLTRPTKAGPTFQMGTNFSSPSTALTGLSYSFDYENARFVLLDQFMAYDGSSSASGNYSTAAQQTWVTGQLSSSTRPAHAFVFAHKGIVTDNHADNLFGADPGLASTSTATDAFITSLADNGVHYLFGGHDHMHLHEVVSTTSLATQKSVHEVVCQSDSYKFYTPYSPSNDATYDCAGSNGTYGLGACRQQRVGEELWNVGYYIVTVDGNNVTVDYYGVPLGATDLTASQISIKGSTTTYSIADGPTSGVDLNISATPTLTGLWEKHDTFGYGLDGKEFVVAQGAAYTTVTGSYANAATGNRTTAAILGGTNTSTSTDPLRTAALVKAVATGWSSQTDETYSDLFTLWGRNEVGSTVTDTYPLAVSYAGLSSAVAASGSYGLAEQDEYGNWVNAVGQNYGGTAAFVAGPWSAGYGLGTYGVDTATSPPTAWAVLDHQGTFAVAAFE
jgi:hypothetical protein